MQVFLLDSDDPQAQPRLVEPRVPGLSYFVDHHEDKLLLLVFEAGSIDYEVMHAPISTPGRR